MAKTPIITLAGGIKAPPHRLAEPHPVQAVSTAFAAFETLANALAEACAAEEFLNDPSSWDIAYPNPDVAAEDAVNVALEAARAAGNAPVVLVSDRVLVFIARFIHCAMGVENGPDRVNMLHLLEDSQRLWFRSSTGHIARHGDDLIACAVERLLNLTDLLYGPANFDNAMMATS